MEILFTAIWALALCGVFNGARRLASRKNKKDGLGELLVSLILAIGLAVASFIQYQNVVDLQVASNVSIISDPIDKDMRAIFDPDNEAHRTMTFSNASHAFLYAGEIRQHLTSDGAWVEYCPTEEDIKKRDRLVSLQADLEWITGDWRSATTYWIVPISLALLLGLFTGRNGNRRGSGD